MIYTAYELRALLTFLTLTEEENKISFIGKDHEWDSARARINSDKEKYETNN
jgi:hypothetical protein